MCIRDRYVFVFKKNCIYVGIGINHILMRLIGLSLIHILTMDGKSKVAVRINMLGAAMVEVPVGFVERI